MSGRDSDFAELIAIRCRRGGGGATSAAAAARPSAFEATGSFQSDAGAGGEPDCLLCVLTNWCNTRDLNVCMSNTLERRKKRVCFSVFVYSVEAARLSSQLLFAPRLKQTKNKMSLK